MGTRRTETREKENLIPPWHLLDIHLTGAHKVKAVLFLDILCMSLPVVNTSNHMFYTHESVSFYFCLHIFFVVKNKTISIFSGLYNLRGLFNANVILLEEQQWFYLTHSWEDKGVHTFPKGICPKVNMIARLEFELVYYHSAGQCFNNDTTRTPPCRSESMSTSSFTDWL